MIHQCIYDTQHTMEDGFGTDLKNKKILIIFTEMDDWSEEDKRLSVLSVEELVKELNGVGLTNIFVKKIVEPIDECFFGFDPKETVVFNWTESWGNDGTDYWTIPDHLEKLGYVFTGSSAACLRETIDKVAVKMKMLELGLPTPLTKIYDTVDSNGWKTFPALVKPAREHCSTGVTRDAVVDDANQLHRRVEYILNMYGPHGVIVEDFIEGNEYNVSVWGNDTPEVLPIGMIDYSAFDDYHDRICGFDAKWVEGSKEWVGTEVICPAPLSAEMKKKLEGVAISAYKIFGLRDYARIDIRVRDETPFILDVNSNPDITTSGGLVRSIRRAGYTYGAGVAKILGMALARMPK